MSYNARVDGELEITPPLTWPDLKGNPFHKEKPGYYDIRIDVEETKVDTAEGELVKRVGVSLSYGGAVTDIRAYSVEKDVAEALRYLPKGTTLRGWLDCLGEDGAVWRITVQDGQVVKVDPELVWPEWMK
jgi:hypothetical protein